MADILAPAPSGADDGAVLSRFFAAQPDASSIAFPAGAHYQLLSELTIERKTGLHVNAAGAVFDGSNRTTKGAFITFSRCSGLVWSGSEVIGCPTGVDHYEHRHCYNVRSCFDLTLTDVKALRNLSGGDGIYIGDSSLHVLVDGFFIEEQSRQGLSVIYTRDVTARNGVIREQQTFNLVDIEPLGGAAGESNDGVVLEAIRFGSYRYAAGRYAVSGAANTNSNVEIRGCTAEPGVPMLIRDTHNTITPRNKNWIIADNVCATPAAKGWYFERTDGVSVSGNKVVFAKGVKPVRSSGCTGVHVAPDNVWH